MFQSQTLHTSSRGPPSYFNVGGVISVRKTEQAPGQYHPDKQGPGVTVTEAEEHLHRFVEVDQAWKVLSNQETKREYDLQLRASELNQSWPVDASVCLDDMTWDDDHGAYTYGCRCGGEYSVRREEAEEAIVCCDTCSLSIEVKRTT
ncbi:hypothetical protein UPYG_G00268660 [Umbra pygmaea]|uniref:DPH-type MB domain-containing protein n=1 Tax=Umbra pygmaea TaxID=75934 RepID=A0ABD0WY18_UMBPY